MRAQKWANGQKMEGEGSREASGAGVGGNQPAHMEERGAEETLSDYMNVDETANQASTR